MVTLMVWSWEMLVTKLAKIQLWQWCWWRYIGDLFKMLVAQSFCWRLFSLFSQCRSPTFQTCHQYIWSPTYVTNIDVTSKNVRETYRNVRKMLSWFRNFRLSWFSTQIFLRLSDKNDGNFINRTIFVIFLAWGQFCDIVI